MKKNRVRKVIEFVSNKCFQLNRLIFVFILSKCLFIENVVIISRFPFSDIDVFVEEQKKANHHL